MAASDQGRTGGNAEHNGNAGHNGYPGQYGGVIWKTIIMEEKGPEHGCKRAVLRKRGA
jgi:hypothetical protein